jgi:hypothetical protein
MQLTIYTTTLLVLLFVVTFRGTFPERAIVWVALIADVADQIYHAVYGPSDFRLVDWVHVAIDSSGFAVVLWIALGANRFWPLPVCSLHLLGLTGHAAVLFGLPGINQIYWAMLNVTDYVQVPIIFAGTIAHSRRVARIGRYRDWRHGWLVPTFLRQNRSSPLTT